MTEQHPNLSCNLTFDTAASHEPAADIVATFRFFDEKAGISQPGKTPGDVLLVQKPASGYQIVVSLGSADKATTETVRRAGGGLGKWLVKHHAARVDLDLDSLTASGIEDAASAALEGVRLGAYKFVRYKKVEEPAFEVRVTMRSVSGPEQSQALIERAIIVTDAVILARDLSHQPANVINPVTLAEEARAVAERCNLGFTVLDEARLAKLGAGAILAVGKGSQTPPRLIVLEYPGTDPQAQPVVLVGKAITFDTGGYSIKDTSNIVGMKYDKCGGVNVLAALQAAAGLKLKTPVIGIIAAAENMISGEAYRPDDILTAMNGKTIEIISTDAEGRLVLADALTYAQRNYQPRALIDLATLTGGVVVALGRVRAGLLSNDDQLADALFQAGEKSFERLWRLPLDEEYSKNMKGDDADLKNSGGREGHCILGGAFIQEFVEPGTAWAHLDIAGMADTPKDLPYAPKGPTGFGIRLLINYLESL